MFLRKLILLYISVVLIVAGGVGDTTAASSTVEMLNLDSPAGRSASPAQWKCSTWTPWQAGQLVQQGGDAPLTCYRILNTLSQC